MTSRHSCVVQLVLVQTHPQCGSSRSFASFCSVTRLSPQSIPPCCVFGPAVSESSTVGASLKPGSSWTLRRLKQTGPKIHLKSGEEREGLRRRCWLSLNGVRLQVGAPSLWPVRRTLSLSCGLNPSLLPHGSERLSLSAAPLSPSLPPSLPLFTPSHLSSPARQ